MNILKYIHEFGYFKDWYCSIKIKIIHFKPSEHHIYQIKLKSVGQNNMSTQLYVFC